jgi:hypothetical protein
LKTGDRDSHGFAGILAGPVASQELSALRTMKSLNVRTVFLLLAAAVASSSLQAESPALPAGITRVPVVFTGGHDTEGQDRGRPVNLIAAALGVPAEVFREAFSHVKPARAGTAPEPNQVRENKAALMNALGKHGVTNDRLDTVSNYYRYARGRNELWTHRDAVANALVKDGKVTSFELVDAGAGYSSVPQATVAGVKDAQAKVELAFGKYLAKNGSIAVLKVQDG